MRKKNEKAALLKWPKKQQEYKIHLSVYNCLHVLGIYPFERNLKV